eukprot:m.251015 g.251015  ORF g.251015 m.251015 type:complete len:788 (+) comp19102_c4_seq1:319-2682(+)
MVLLQGFPPPPAAAAAAAMHLLRCIWQAVAFSLVFGAPMAPRVRRSISVSTRLCKTIDIFFVIDRSQTISESDFRAVITKIMELVTYLHTINPSIQFGVMLFSTCDATTTILRPDRTGQYGFDAVMQTLESNRDHGYDISAGHRTEPDCPLDKLVSKELSSMGRQGFVFFFTDGIVSSDRDNDVVRENSKRLAEEIRRQGHQLNVVAVGQPTDMDFLTEISDGPVPEFQDYKALVKERPEELFNTVCYDRNNVLFQWNCSYGLVVVEIQDAGEHCTLLVFLEEPNREFSNFAVAKGPGEDKIIKVDGASATIFVAVIDAPATAVVKVDGEERSRVVEYPDQSIIMNTSSWTPGPVRLFDSPIFVEGVGPGEIDLALGQGAPAGVRMASNGSIFLNGTLGLAPGVHDFPVHAELGNGDNATSCFFQVVNLQVVVPGQGSTRSLPPFVIVTGGIGLLLLGLFLLLWRFCRKKRRGQAELAQAPAAARVSGRGVPNAAAQVKQWCNSQSASGHNTCTEVEDAILGRVPLHGSAIVACRGVYNHNEASCFSCQWIGCNPKTRPMAFRDEVFVARSVKQLSITGGFGAIPEHLYGKIKDVHFGEESHQFLYLLNAGLAVYRGEFTDAAATDWNSNVIVQVESIFNEHGQPGTKSLQLELPSAGQAVPRCLQPSRSYFARFNGKSVLLVGQCDEPIKSPHVTHVKRRWLEVKAHKSLRVRHRCDFPDVQTVEQFWDNREHIWETAVTPVPTSPAMTPAVPAKTDDPPDHQRWLTLLGCLFCIAGVAVLCALIV